MTLDELKAKRAEISAAVHAIEEAERAKALRACVGKFYKFRNSYSCPQKQSDYWWLHAAVFESDGLVRSVKFQTDKNGLFSFEDDSYFFVTDGYVEIKELEFAKALDEAHKRFNDLTKKALGQ